MELGRTDYCGKLEMINQYKNNVKEEKMEKCYITEIITRVEYNMY
jgi:hypothetical protein